MRLSEPAPSVSPMTSQPLSDLERRVLDFEGAKTWRYQALKEDAIRKQLGLTPVHYQQILVALTHHPAALAYAPVLVHRLQRLRRQRRAS